MDLFLLMRYPDLAIRVSALGFVRTGSLQHSLRKSPIMCFPSAREELSSSEGSETKHGV